MNQTQRKSQIQKKCTVVKNRQEAKEQSNNNYALLLDLPSHLSVRKKLDWPAKLDFSSLIWHEILAQSDAYLGPFIPSTRGKTSLGRKRKT